MCAETFRPNITTLIAVVGLGFISISVAGQTNSPPYTAETNRPVAHRSLGPIPVDQAKQALTNLNTPKPGPGTWRKMDVIDAMDIIETNITYQWHGPDGRHLERSEDIHSATRGGKNAKRDPQPTVTVRNEEGSWALHDRVAILWPPRADAASSEKSGAPTKSPANDDDELLDDPQIATNMVVTGERIKEGDRVVLCITSKLGDKGQQRLDVLVEQKLKEAKKEVPLLLRPVLAAFPLKKMLLKVLPVRTENLIDEDTRTLVLERGYNRNGELVMQEWAWAPWPDLSPESYEIPKSLKLLRPKNSEEAGRLEANARKEDEKLRSSR